MKQMQLTSYRTDRHDYETILQATIPHHVAYKDIRSIIIDMWQDMEGNYDNHNPHDDDDKRLNDHNHRHNHHHYNHHIHQDDHRDDDEGDDDNRDDDDDNEDTSSSSSIQMAHMYYNANKRSINNNYICMLLVALSTITMLIVTITLRESDMAIMIIAYVFGSVLFAGIHLICYCYADAARMQCAFILTYICSFSLLFIGHLCSRDNNIPLVIALLCIQLLLTCFCCIGDYRGLPSYRNMDFCRFQQHIVQVRMISKKSLMSCFFKSSKHFNSKYVVDENANDDSVSESDTRSLEWYKRLEVGPFIVRRGVPLWTYVCCCSSALRSILPINPQLRISTNTREYDVCDTSGARRVLTRLGIAVRDESVFSPSIALAQLVSTTGD